ncbi:ATP-grasp domain-containing protein [Crocinitomix catalasitica]|uniref:ATP-grasp domain-containing protein n=1 Tax=Crocinitomix catalasitica TaxID=184607 RepID=UPI000489220E|nr:hypothetical protein [Crocinitomix catalasitica]
MKYDVVILTQEKYIAPNEPDWYSKQVIKEDALIVKALEEQNLKAIKKDWADPNFDWNDTKSVLFRTTWDYFDRFEEFKSWLNAIRHKTRLINSFELIEWNFDKKYLLDLQTKGIPIVDTHIIQQGSTMTLLDLQKSLNWPKMVLKPTVSGAGRHTYLIDTENISQHESVLAELLQNEDMMLQPFIENIKVHGEVSHIVIGGEYSHAILKLAQEGEFRVQDDFGGTTHLYAPSNEEKELAIAIVEACPTLPAYARVDLMWNDKMELILGEIELIEPELWFRNYPNASTQLAEFVKKNYF